MIGLGPTLQAMIDDDQFIAPRSDTLDPSRFGLSQGTDPSRAILSVAEVFCPHEIVLRNPGAAIDFTHASARVDRTTFNQISYGSELDILIRDTDRAQYIFLVPLRGQMHVHTPDGTGSLEVGTSMLMGPDTQYRFDHDGEDSHLAVGIPRRLIEVGDDAVLTLMRGTDPEAISDPTGSLIDYLSFVCRELNRGGTSFDSPAVRSGVEDVIVGMIKSLPSTSKHGTPAVPIVPAPVRRAELFMDDHLTDDITIDDIAEAAGVPVRTLYQAFGHFRSMPPMRSLRNRHLDQARRDLIAGADENPNILDIANRYGMQHGGRFAAYYQQRFGETPSDTLRAARLTLPRLRQNFADTRR